MTEDEMVNWGFPCSSAGKECACSAGDPGSVPGSGRSPGEGNGNPLQHPCLENLTDREAWWAAVHGGHKESATTERLIHTQLNGHEIEQAPGDGEGQGSLAFCSPWGHKELNPT